MVWFGGYYVGVVDLMYRFDWRLFGSLLCVWWYLLCLLISLYCLGLCLFLNSSAIFCVWVSWLWLHFGMLL